MNNNKNGKPFIPSDIKEEKACPCYCHTVTGSGKACIACPDEFCFPTQEEKDFEIGYCKKCIQSTNHLEGICQKCKPPHKSPEWEEEFERMYPKVLSLYTEYFNCKVSMKDFISNLLSQKDEGMVEKIRQEFMKVAKDYFLDRKVEVGKGSIILNAGQFWTLIEAGISPSKE